MPVFDKKPSFSLKRPQREMLPGCASRSPRCGNCVRASREPSFQVAEQRRSRPVLLRRCYALPGLFDQVFRCLVVLEVRVRNDKTAD
jgi:hypothetical protein